MNSFTLLSLGFSAPGAEAIQFTPKIRREERTGLESNMLCSEVTNAHTSLLRSISYFWLIQRTLSHSLLCLLVVK